MLRVLSSTGLGTGGVFSGGGVESNQVELSCGRTLDRNASWSCRPCAMRGRAASGWRRWSFHIRGVGIGVVGDVGVVEGGIKKWWELRLRANDAPVSATVSLVTTRYLII